MTAFLFAIFGLGVGVLGMSAWFKYRDAKELGRLRAEAAQMKAEHDALIEQGKAALAAAGLSPSQLADRVRRDGF